MAARVKRLTSRLALASLVAGGRTAVADTANAAQGPRWWRRTAQATNGTRAPTKKTRMIEPQHRTMQVNTLVAPSSRIETRHSRAGLCSSAHLEHLAL